MGGSIRKQYRLLAGRPILARTLQAVSAGGEIERIFLVVPKADFAFCKQHVIEAAQLATEVRLLAGGGATAGFRL